MLALLGVTPDGLPSIFANSTGSVSYNATTDLFEASATPVSFTSDLIPFPAPISSGNFDLAFEADSNGALVGGTAGDDFVLTGSIDIDFDGNIDVSGVLLTGEVVEFGFQDSGASTNTDSYDFRIVVTGGELAASGVLTSGAQRPNYFDGKDVAMQIGSENSTFVGSFDVDFQGGNKVDLGPIESTSRPINPEIEIVKFVDKVETRASMHVIDFEGLATGTIVDNQFPDVTISAAASIPSYGNRAMIFDSANPTGGDLDLGTPNSDFGGPGIGSGGQSNTEALGNVLIISEDGDSSDPDDDARGGTFTFTFDEPVTLNHLELLDIDSNEQGGSVITVTSNLETTSFTIPALGDNSLQLLPINIENVTEFVVDFVSSGAISEIKFTKFTQEKVWYDANTAPGVDFEIGEFVEFSYHVMNPGDVELFPVNVIDDNATPTDTNDDFVPDPVEFTDGFNVGDLDQDNRLDPGEEWLYSAGFFATQLGQFENIALVTGTPVDEFGSPLGDSIKDDDPANYSVSGKPGISIEKTTNGVQADTVAEAVEIVAGDAVTWNYFVENTGTLPFVETEVVVVDDNGTPDDSSDDFYPELIAASDVGGDGILSPGEVWEYTFESVALQLGSSAGTSVLSFSGNSPLDGPNGNVRTYSVDGVQVKASAFSLDGSGNWKEAFLGEFSSGLGVTDNSEGNGRNGLHRVDNVHEKNFVVLEFSEDVVVDKVFLDSVVNDSDLSVWLGTVDDAFDNDLTLNDAVLAGLVNEVNNTSSSQSRFANINGGAVAGNVLILAASTVDHTPEDRFKIRNVKFERLGSDVYRNVGSVQVTGVSDQDPSHYRNKIVDKMFEAEDFQWRNYPWKVKSSSNASGGMVLKVPEGTGNYYHLPSHKSVKYEFHVGHTGKYSLSALLKAADHHSNSLWVKVNNGSWIEWHMDVTGSSFDWQNVTDTPHKNPVEFHLNEGINTLNIKVREDGLKLDKFKLSKID